MTEDEWLACSDPQPMLELLRGKASDRKLRLFALACFRPYRFMLVPATLEALEVAERLAEGTVSPAERKRARDRAFHALGIPITRCGIAGVQPRTVWPHPWAEMPLRRPCAWPTWRATSGS